MGIGCFLRDVKEKSTTPVPHGHQGYHTYIRTIVCKVFVVKFKDLFSKLKSTMNCQKSVRSEIYTVSRTSIAKMSASSITPSYSVSGNRTQPPPCLHTGSGTGRWTCPRISQWSEESVSWARNMRGSPAGWMSCTSSSGPRHEWSETSGR